MSKIREIKKDITYLCEQMILDAIQLSEIVDKKHKDKVYSMITDISVFHNELIARVNHPDGKDNPKLVKSYFKNISIELLSGSDKFYEKMNSLLPKEK